MWHECNLYNYNYSSDINVGNRLKKTIRLLWNKSQSKVSNKNIRRHGWTVNFLAQRHRVWDISNILGIKEGSTCAKCRDWRKFSPSEPPLICRRVPDYENTNSRMDARSFNILWPFVKKCSLVQSLGLLSLYVAMFVCLSAWCWNIINRLMHLFCESGIAKPASFPHSTGNFNKPLKNRHRVIKKN